STATSGAARAPRPSRTTSPAYSPGRVPSSRAPPRNPGGPDATLRVHLYSGARAPAVSARWNSTTVSFATGDRNMGRPSRHWASRHRAAALAAAVLTALPPAASFGDDKCTPSKFGPQDQIGALNNVPPAKTLAASKLVTRGK